jgi:hypothetical protein
MPCILARRHSLSVEKPGLPVSCTTAPNVWKPIRFLHFAAWLVTRSFWSRTLVMVGGGLLARHEFGIEDAEILRAIHYHHNRFRRYVGAGSLIYVADKVERREPTATCKRSGLQRKRIWSMAFAPVFSSRSGSLSRTGKQPSHP